MVLYDGGKHAEEVSSATNPLLPLLSLASRTIDEFLAASTTGYNGPKTKEVGAKGGLAPSGTPASPPRLDCSARCGVGFQGAAHRA